MLAPPNRNTRPSRTRCVPERATNEPVGCGAACAGVQIATSTASANRPRRTQAFLGSVLAGVAAAVAAAMLGSPGVAFDAHASDRLVLTTPVYRMTVAKRNGRILDLTDRSTGTSVLRGGSACLWSATRIGGCTARRVSYRWQPATATLTFQYTSPGFGVAVVTLQALPDHIDLRLTLRNLSRLRSAVRFPDGLVGE